MKRFMKAFFRKLERKMEIRVLGPTDSNNDQEKKDDHSYRRAKTNVGTSRRQSKSNRKGSNQSNRRGSNRE